MGYANSHVLALFEREDPLWCNTANIAVQKNVSNYLNKVGSSTLKFANYDVKASKALQPIHIVVTDEESGKTVASPVNLSAVGVFDRLIIFGHGDGQGEILAEYSPTDLADCLVKWGLQNVATIYLCACELGMWQFPHKFAAALSGTGKVSWMSIRAPQGVVQIDQSGRKTVFKDANKEVALEKGKNKVIIDRF